MRISDWSSDVCSSDQCAAGNAAVCSQLSFQGAQLLIDGPSLNLSQIKTRGVDMELTYSTMVGAGRLSVRALGRYLATFDTKPPGSPAIDPACDIRFSISEVRREGQEDVLRV